MHSKFPVYCGARMLTYTSSVTITSIKWHILHYCTALNKRFGILKTGEIVRTVVSAHIHFQYFLLSKYLKK